MWGRLGNRFRTMLGFTARRIVCIEPAGILSAVHIVRIRCLAFDGFWGLHFLVCPRQDWVVAWVLNRMDWPELLHCHTVTHVPQFYRNVQPTIVWMWTVWRSSSFKLGVRWDSLQCFSHWTWPRFYEKYYKNLSPWLRLLQVADNSRKSCKLNESQPRSEWNKLLRVV